MLQNLEIVTLTKITVTKQITLIISKSLIPALLATMTHTATTLIRLEWTTLSELNLYKQRKKYKPINTHYYEKFR